MLSILIPGGVIIKIEDPNVSILTNFADRAAGIYKSMAVRDNMDPTQPRDGVVSIT